MAYYYTPFVAIMRRLVAVAALLLLAAPASGSLLESTTEGLLGPALGPVLSDPTVGPALQESPVPVPDRIHYQADAGTEHDAPDTCEDVLASDLPFDLPVSTSLDGLLVPVDDEVDHYRVPIGQELVGGRVTVSVLGRDATLPLSIDVSMPACGTSVTAEENQPATPPTVPQPSEGEKQVSPHNLDGAYECSDRWFFVMNQFRELQPPESIHVVWTDGSEEDVPLLKDTPATLAQYATSEHLGFTIHSATANVPEGWTGQFNLGEGSCAAVDGGAVFGEPSVATQTSVTFTPIVAGTYVLAVRTVPPEAPGLPPLGTSVPASCHSFCALAPGTAMDLSGYTARAD